MKRKELRKKIFEVVSKNGGHLSSNLGVVEATIAMTSVFSEDDDIVWDVGHQSYAFKILTGRLDKIDTIRTKGGLSGFTSPEESVRDKFKSGTDKKHNGDVIEEIVNVLCGELEEFFVKSSNV